MANVPNVFPFARTIVPVPVFTSVPFPEIVSAWPLSAGRYITPEAAFNSSVPAVAIEMVLAAPEAICEVRTKRPALTATGPVAARLPESVSVPGPALVSAVTLVPLLAMTPETVSPPVLNCCTTSSYPPRPFPAVNVPPEIVNAFVPVASKPPPVRVSVVPPSASDCPAAGASIFSVLVLTLSVSVVLAEMRELLASEPAKARAV